MERGLYGLQNQIWRTIRNQRTEVKEYIETQQIDKYK